MDKHFVGMSREVSQSSPVLAYSHHVQQWFGFAPPRLPGEHLIPFIFGSAIFFYGGMPLVEGGIGEIGRRKPGMMTPISVAVVVAYSYSVAVTFGLPGEALYWELATLVTIMLLGHWLQMRAVEGARGALDEIARLLPETTTLVSGEEQREVPVSDLESGDAVLVRPGALRVRISETGEDTALAGIMRLVAKAQASSSGAERLADRAAFWLTLIALGSAAITALAWSLWEPGLPLSCRW